MRQGSNGRRPRGRPNRRQHGGAPQSNNYDSNGPDGRIRGGAYQVYEKYVNLARDAVSAGDRVSAETFYQHAEHYFRILNSSTDPQPNDQGHPGRRGGNGQADDKAFSGRRQASPQAPNEVDGQRAQSQQTEQVDAQPPAQVERRPGDKPADKPAGEPEPKAQPDEDSETTGA